MLLVAVGDDVRRAEPPRPSHPSIEVVPFGGYRIGGSGATGSPYMPIVYDAGGGVSFGALVDVPYGPPQDGLKFEALFSHERSWIEVQGLSLFDPKTRVDVTVDHLMVGGVQELDTAPGRAFIGGLFGLSRYAAPDEVDVRFTIGLSAGAKFFANRHVGLRIDARGYMTIVSLSGVGRLQRRLRRRLQHQSGIPGRLHRRHDHRVLISSTDCTD